MVTLISEIDLATATIVGEAEGEPYEGQLAVAGVIKRRARDRFYSDGTVAGTVLWPFQFSLWNTSEHRRIATCNRDYQEPIIAQCKRAWLEATDDGEAVMYHNKHMNPYPPWATSSQFVKTAEIGNHLFYKKAK